MSKLGGVEADLAPGRTQPVEAGILIARKGIGIAPILRQTAVDGVQMGGDPPVRVLGT
jgi:hypothetical protein